MPSIPAWWTPRACARPASTRATSARRSRRGPRSAASARPRTSRRLPCSWRPAMPAGSRAKRCSSPAVCADADRAETAGLDPPGRSVWQGRPGDGSGGWAGPREPEARGPQRAEADRDQEGEAIAAGHVVHEPAEPRGDAAPDAVAHAQEAVDRAEARREELRGHGGDDRSTGAEAEAEEDGVGVERRHVRPHLEPEQAERPQRRAAVGDGGRGGAPDAIGRDAEADATHHRE